MSGCSGLFCASLIETLPIDRFRKSPMCRDCMDSISSLEADWMLYAICSFRRPVAFPTGVTVTMISSNVIESSCWACKVGDRNAAPAARIAARGALDWQAIKVALILQVQHPSNDAVIAESMVKGAADVHGHYRQ